MDLKMLLDKQNELDKTILDNAGLKEYPLQSMQLALLVEVGELANEWQGFKHWKRNKEINREKLLEEFADCFSFALSLENYLNQLKHDELHKMNREMSRLSREVKEKGIKNDVIRAFTGYFRVVSFGEGFLAGLLALGMCLDISLDEMQKAYLKKNDVNWQRQQEGY